MALVNYNRALLTNLANSTAFALPGASNQLILEFGLLVSPATNFVELLATIGWAINTLPVEPDQPTLELTILQDGALVASINQESIENGPDTPLENLSTFQAVLTNVPVGHHVYQLFARNLMPAQGMITIIGPANISGKVISQ